MMVASSVSSSSSRLYDASHAPSDALDPTQRAQQEGNSLSDGLKLGLESLELLLLRIDLLDGRVEAPLPRLAFRLSASKADLETVDRSSLEGDLAPRLQSTKEEAKVSLGDRGGWVKDGKGGRKEGRLSSSSTRAELTLVCSSCRP